MREAGEALSAGAKAELLLRLWALFLRVLVGVRLVSLPDLVGKLGKPDRRSSVRYSPQRLARVVHRGLRIGRRRPRCLTSALVMYGLLRQQGDRAELVIGLLPEAPSPIAHAWVEIDGVDVGPPPGRGRHQELARFG